MVRLSGLVQPPPSRPSTRRRRADEEPMVPSEDLTPDQPCGTNVRCVCERARSLTFAERWWRRRTADIWGLR